MTTLACRPSGRGVGVRQVLVRHRRVGHDVPALRAVVETVRVPAAELAAGTGEGTGDDAEDVARCGLGRATRALFQLRFHLNSPFRFSRIES